MRVMARKRIIEKRTWFGVIATVIRERINLWQSSERRSALIWYLADHQRERTSDMSLMEALDFAAKMNRERALGFSDWRLPNRRELRSLMSHQTRKTALPHGHPSSVDEPAS
jgi:hypothetical protein